MNISLIHSRCKRGKHRSTATTPQVAIDSCLSRKMRAGLPEKPQSVWRHYFIAEHVHASKRAQTPFSQSNSHQRLAARLQGRACPSRQTRLSDEHRHFRPCDLSAPIQVDIVFRTARIRSRSIVPLPQTANWRGAKIGKSDSRTCTQQRGLTSGLPETSPSVWLRCITAEHAQKLENAPNVISGALHQPIAIYPIHFNGTSTSNWQSRIK